MEKPEHSVVLITAATTEEAQRLADLLLEKRLAACVNIVPGVNSRFWWQGKQDAAEESLLIVKTKAARLEAIVGLVKENHSYSVPEVIALPIIGGNRDYLDWLDKEVA